MRWQDVIVYIYTMYVCQVGVIPARYASVRFPGKPLADIMGKPMVVRTWEQACKASTLDLVIPVFLSVAKYASASCMCPAYGTVWAGLAQRSIRWMGRSL